MCSSVCAAIAKRMIYSCNPVQLDGGNVLARTLLVSSTQKTLYQVQAHLVQASGVLQEDGTPAAHIGAQTQVHVLHSCAAVPAANAVNALLAPACATDVFQLSAAGPYCRCKKHSAGHNAIAGHVLAAGAWSALSARPFATIRGCSDLLQEMWLPQDRRGQLRARTTRQRCR